MEDLDQQFERIADHLNDAVELRDKQKYKAAHKAALKALTQLEKPYCKSPLAVIVYSAIGDIYFAEGDFEGALKSFFAAHDSSGGVNANYVQLKLGMTFFEQGKTDKAKDYLLKAYLNNGSALFLDIDKKYSADLPIESNAVVKKK